MPPFIGEIRMFAGTFAPAGWALCNGQQLAIAENDALFTLIGTTYGGDGEQTFSLPNLQSRIPVHMGTAPSGTTHQIGEMEGVEQVTLTVAQIPTHNHPLVATLNQGSQNPPSTSVLLAQMSTQNAFPYGTDVPPAQLNGNSLTQAGGTQPHENTQPYLCINFIISLYGIFPSRN
jgi:microcystin-dependent protein